MTKLIQTTLVGIGQIFLQENGLSGLLIAIGMFFGHWTLGVSCIAGSLIGTLVAEFRGYEKSNIRAGLYGFNGSLAFMCALFTFGLTDASNPMIWVLGAISAVVSTLLMHQFIQCKRVAFTFPFVLTCWFTCWAVAHFGLFGLSQTTPALANYTDSIHSITEPFYAWAEVNFTSSGITGLFLFAAIAINSPTAAMWGLAVSPISALMAYHFFNIDANSLANGLYSFSAVLVACTFAGSRFIDFCYTIAAVVLAVIIQFVVAQTGLATYTFGFIAASWIMLWIKNRLDKTSLPQSNIGKMLNP